MREYDTLMGADTAFKKPLQAMNALATAKRMFQRVFTEVVAETIDDPADVPAEISELLAALAGAR